MLDRPKSEGGKLPAVPLRVLMTEDNPRDAKLVARLLEGGGFAVQYEMTDSLEFFRKRLEEVDFDVILADFNLRNWTALDALETLKESQKDIPLIVVTGSLGDEAAAECIKHGAADFVLKDRQARLPAAVRRALEERRLRNENKRAFEAVSRLGAIVGSSSDAIIGMTLAGTITSWNNGAEQIYGYSVAEVLGRHISVLAPPDRTEEVTQILARLTRVDRIDPFETVRVRKDGSLVDVSLSVFPITDSQGALTGAASIARDITRRKRVERELREAKEAAEAASQMKSEFLAVMSHEIRTPMNGIIGMTQLALETPLSLEQREYLDMVKESSDALLTLVNDILDFSKIEAGRLSLEVDEFDLQDTLNNTMRTLAPRADEKGLELTWETPPDVPARLIGDPGRLRQILVNLVGNAIKFTELGEVALSAEIEAQRDNWATLHFCVSDTGIGIAQEKHQRIFEAFMQADSSTTRKYGGTGLGLAISTLLVKMMEGRIWLESVPNEGSRFHFTAKFGLVKDIHPQPVPMEMVNLEGTPILVIEDNATNRRILKVMLNSWSMQATSVPTVHEGLEAMRHAKELGRPFPLILLDAQMPGKDGFTVIEKLREDSTLAGTAIILMTARGQRGDAARCRDLGISAYLVKPICQSDLLETILLVLGQPSQANDRPALVTRHTIREARRKLRILVAEDNAINRELVTRLLQKCGHTVLAVANGLEAVELLENEAGHWNLILMDVEMPKMDGFQATAVIRGKEKISGKHIPIIAMTANAMKGDRERCLAAGMDAYIPKPIQHQDLTAAIQALAAEVPNNPIESPSKRPPAEVFDEAAFVSHVDGDPQLLRDLVDMFFEECPLLVNKIRAGLDRSDAKAVQKAAHSLRGSTSNLGAQMASGVALKLEDLARAGDLPNAESVLQALEWQLNTLRPALIAVRAETESWPA